MFWKKKSQTNTTPYYFPERIAMYTAFKNEIYDPKSVLYPSCGFDASPARVFDKVKFVDKEAGNNGCIRVLQGAGFDAVLQDMREYIPSRKHDAVILVDPVITADLACAHVASGGYVLTNNYHGTASWLNSRPEQFKLVAVLDCVAGVGKVERNVDGHLAATVPLESIAQARPLEHLMFEHTREAGQDTGLPFKRVADLYVFVQQ